MNSTPETKRFLPDLELKQWIKDIRRQIHRHPELSYNEINTSRLIQKKLQEIGLECRGGLAGTGVIAEIGNTKKEQQKVGLRADMDALPIEEMTGLSFASKNKGIMHACGHDGHVAMLLGAAVMLKTAPLPGGVRLIFQPAEEHGNGAERLVNEHSVLDGVGAVFAGHIDTHLPTGVITVDEGIVCAWADPFQIVLKGRSGHAARPHHAVDSVVAAANLVMSAQTLVSRGVDPNRAAVVTFGCMHAGTAQNVIAREAVLKGTVRSTHTGTRKNTLDGLQRIVESIGRMYGVETELSFAGAIPAVENDAFLTTIAKRACRLTEGVLNVQSQGASSLGAEDFAFYLQKVPGCMVRFGASLGENAGVSHSGTYDFDEDVLAIGAGWYANTAWEWLNMKYCNEKT